MISVLTLKYPGHIRFRKGVAFNRLLHVVSGRASFEFELGIEGI